MLDRGNVMNVDPIVKERLVGMISVLNSLEIDPEMWDPNNPIWQNTNNHVLYSLRVYYYENEKDPELKAIMGSLIDHLVWLYISAPEIRARLGWIVWFFIVYVTDNQFRKETGVALLPEEWNDPRKWALAYETTNPVKMILTPADTTIKKDDTT
jgi:hypothetical protein